MPKRVSQAVTGGSSPVAVAVPAAVQANARACAVWEEMVAALGASLTPLNRPVLVTYCLAVARLEDAQGKLGAVGPLVKKGNRPEINPLLEVVERELRIVREAAKELEAAQSPWKRK